MNRIPTRPVPAPLIEMPRMVTTSDAPAFTTMAVVPEERIDAKVPIPLMVIALVMVTAPYPPGSRASISPPGAVLLMAPAKVLQGAVREQGFTSSPTPETHVRVAWAIAGADTSRASRDTRRTEKNRFILRLQSLPCSIQNGCG